MRRGASFSAPRVCGVIRKQCMAGRREDRLRIAGTTEPTGRERSGMLPCGVGVAVAVGVVVEVDVGLDVIVMGCEVLTAARPLRRACRRESRAKRSAMIKWGCLYHASQMPVTAGRCPLFLRMSGHHLRSVRTSRGVARSASTRRWFYHDARRRQDGERNEAKPAKRHGAALAECAESCGAKWRSRGDGAELPCAKRCALHRYVSQCAFKRSKIFCCKIRRNIK